MWTVARLGLAVLVSCLVTSVVGGWPSAARPAGGVDRDDSPVPGAPHRQPSHLAHAADDGMLQEHTKGLKLQPISAGGSEKVISAEGFSEGEELRPKLFRGPRDPNVTLEQTGESYKTPTRQLIPRIESKGCLSKLSRESSPFNRRVTRRHIPRAYNFMDREWSYKGPGIPDAYKTPCFTKCAVVGSSGVMRGSKWGKVIDSYPAVIRLNNAPTYRHESDVGRRTTVRIMHDGHIAERNVAELMRMDPGGMVVVWPPVNKPKGLGGPGPKPERTKHLAYWLDYANSTILMTRWSKAGFYDSHMMARKVVADYPPHVPSTGWNTMYAALHLCQEIHAYGYAWQMSPETYRRAGHTRVGKAYYWYKHEKGDVNENDYYYKRNIKNPKSKHCFAEEKEAYKNLAKIYNITFH